MLKYFCKYVYVVGLLSSLDVAQGTLVNRQLFPSCTGNLAAALPNFSYAKGSMDANVGFSCIGPNTQYPSPPLSVTWFYYANYQYPATCGNPSLPDGDQCCHSTATSTITFYHTVFVHGKVNIVGTSTGNVTAGKFLGKSASWTLTLNVATLGLNCGKVYGQESGVGQVSLTIGNGPICLNGGVFEFYCPGFH